MLSNHSFHVEIITPQGQVFSGDALIVTVPGNPAPYQVLHKHAPLVSQLEIGGVKIVSVDSKEIIFSVSGGFAEVKNDKLMIIVEGAENTAEIDKHRAEQAKLRAEERIREYHRTRNVSIDVIRAESARIRALNRIKLSSI
ncbi:MAG: ATP synthase F1 subunit epsilon [Chlorobiota bacterium]|jgi:F-type H+-transporting ATPase subunit epsilon|nr:MAG: ATP synthase F1 subunit epsilon [Chlorobiota bacterium]